MRVRRDLINRRAVDRDSALTIEQNLKFVGYCKAEKYIQSRNDVSNPLVFVIVFKHYKVVLVLNHSEYKYNHFSIYI